MHYTQLLFIILYRLQSNFKGRVMILLMNNIVIVVFARIRSNNYYYYLSILWSLHTFLLMDCCLLLLFNLLPCIFKIDIFPCAILSSGKNKIKLVQQRCKLYELQKQAFV